MAKLIEELTVAVTVDRLNLDVWANVQALVIKSKGMEAQNQRCVQEGSYPTWGMDHFELVASEIHDQIKRLGLVAKDAPIQPIQYDTNVKTEDPC